MRCPAPRVAAVGGPRVARVEAPYGIPVMTTLDWDRASVLKTTISKDRVLGA